MSITVKEIRRSRSFASGQSSTYEYMAWGSTDGDAVQDAVLSGTGATAGSDQAPSTVGGMSITAYESEPHEESDGDVHQVTVTYGILDASFLTPTLGREVVSFRISPQTERITHSLQTIQKYGPGGATPTDHKGAIGVEGDRVKGTDIYVPLLAYSVKKTVLTSSISNSFINTLAGIAFHPNNATFRGSAAGECLYFGAASSEITGTLTDISHEFLVSKNLTGRTIGEITGISKKGWEHLWVQYEDSEDDAAKAIAKRALGAYTEKIYEPANLGLTGVSV